MNQIIIIGNVARIPELRTTTTGKDVCSFTVAVHGRNKDKGATFFRVAAFDQMGRNCQKYLDKGSKVSVTGSVSARGYLKDGEPQAQMEIVANDVEFLGSAKKDGYTPVDVPDNPFAG